MAHHHRRYACCNGTAEGNQLQLLQFFLGFVHPGQAQMAIHRRVSVTGEVLHAAQHPAACIGRNGGTAKGRHPLRVIPKAADTNHRICRIAVDILYRCHVEVGSHSLQLTDGDLRSQSGIFRIAGGSQRHGTGNIHRILGQAGHHAPLLVDDDESGIAGFLPDEGLNLAAQLPQLAGAFHIAQKENHIANFIAANQRLKFLGELCAVEAEHQLLPQHFSDFHCFYSFSYRS